jgi:hypothetical protein
MGPKRILVALTLAGTIGCAERRAATRDGTALMADTLARIYARAVADPARNPFLNRERVAALRAVVAQQAGLGALQPRFLLAQELVLAGETREAIAGLEDLLQSTALKLNATSPQNKPFFDLLAIAYLRLGEQENCALNPSANICILPLDGDARHVREEGARKAIGLYERMLRSFPDDRGSRWLLNVSYMAIGGYPGRVPKRWLIPEIDRVKNKAFPRFFNVANTVGVGATGLSGGLCVEDFNRDGLLDLFTTSWGLKDPVHLFLADGQGGYADRSAQPGLTGIVGGLNCVHADYDNDGYEDILILRGAWLGDAGAHPNSLLHNRGDGTFEDVTFAAGLGSFHPTHSAAWADFNLDGLLDLFVGNESGVAMGRSAHPSELFLNNGNGTFTEVSRKVGIDLDAFVKGVVWGDVNNDGLPDLFASVLFGPNRLYLNRGGRSIATWRFEEVSAAAGVQEPLMSFPAWFWDYDNDGWEDLFVLSYDVRNSGALHDAIAMEYLGEPAAYTRDGQRVPVEHSRLYRNKGNGTFADVSRQVGLADKVIYAMGSNFGDLDNDGWLDFYVGTGNPDLRSMIPNRMFRSIEGHRFEEVTIEGGFGHLQKGHGTAFADLDRDGDEDIYMEMGGAYQGDQFASLLFENPGWKDRSWITLELEGRSANRSAIGARVELVVTDAQGTARTLRRTIGTGGSFGAGSLQLHVGLGHAVRVARLRIVWPDAAQSQNTYDNIAVGRTYHVVQGQAPAALDRPPVPFRHDVGAPVRRRHASP